ncbi:MAG: hypothetical protein V1926_06310 [Candidatus Peregrinibacteria bacterium]
MPHAPLLGHTPAVASAPHALLGHHLAEIAVGVGGVLLIVWGFKKLYEKTIGSS